MAPHCVFLIYGIFLARFEEFIDLFLGGFLDESVSLLQKANELFALARNHLEVIFRKPSPALPDASLGLFPFPCDLVPVHDRPLCVL